MTKPRPPGTVEDALDKVIGVLSIASCAAATGRSTGYLRALSDPDKREQLTVIDMIKLDLAHMDAGLPGTPIFEAVGHMLKAAQPEFFSNAYELGRVTVDVVREDSEAHVALIEASLPGADRRALQHALRQEMDSIEAGTRAVVALKASIARTDPPP